MNIYYSPLSFDPNESSDRALQQLDKRHATAMVDIGYQYHAGWGIIRTQLAADVLGNSDGIIADIAYQYPLQFGALHLVPGLGAQWQNAAYNDYYFGINRRESECSGLSYYRPGSGSSPYLSLAIDYDFNPHWTLSLMGRYCRLSDVAKDSPMTECSYTTIIGGGVLYRF